MNAKALWSFYIRLPYIRLDVIRLASHQWANHGICNVNLARNSGLYEVFRPQRAVVPKQTSRE